MLTNSTAQRPPTTPSGWRQRLKQLPRDTRDTLFLLGLIAWVVMLLSSHLPLWCTALTAGVLVWRGWLAWHGQPLPARWWRLLLLAVTVAATLLTYRTILGRDAGVTLIVVLLALKTLELRAQRDAFVVFFLALFTLLTHFSYSQSLLTAVGVLLATWGLLTALVNAHLPAGRPPLWLSARMAGGMALLGLPIMVLLFVLFPRVAPLWGMPADALNARTGLSERMRVGQVAELAQDSSVAMRIRFDGPPPPAQQMYFRGPVLSRFDGQDWRPLQSELPTRLQLKAELQPLGTPVGYEVTLQPHQQNWVLVLDATLQAPALARHHLQATAELQWLSNRPITELVRYRAQSHPEFRHGPLQPQLGLQDHLVLPPGFNPRLMALAQRWRNESPDRADAAPALVQRALATLRTGGYSYTLAPGTYGRDSADEFWFDRKQGFCEHITAAFVVLMRAMDIPARVVTGYQGGELNPIDGYWTVRQSDAHAWAEVWLAGQGWVRVDPTAAVAPSRTDSLARLAPARGVLGTAMVAFSPALGERLQATWEAVNNRWNQWVLNYTQDRQFELLKHLGFESPSWRDLGYLLATLLALASLAAAAWARWAHRQHDPWLRLLTQARQRANQLGVDCGPQTTPRQLAQQLQRQCGPHPSTTAVVNWLLALEALRYAGPSRSAFVAPKASPQQALGQLRQQFALLTWPTRPHLPPPTVPAAPTPPP